MNGKRKAFSSGNSTIQSNNSSRNRMSGNFHSSQKSKRKLVRLQRQHCII
uniref:Uncharacterized protein n=1 Tax=Meloidogyne hapla TaxID=6305 RepID=A0A1I8BKT0_MELHA